MFSNNVTWIKSMKLLQISNLKESHNFGKYLKVPLSGKSLRKADYHYIMEQLVAKLASWKTNFLSFVGRVTLAKSVMEVIPIYHMMTNMLSKYCIDESNKIHRNFIWGNTTDKRRYHVIKWDTITTHKKDE